MSICKICISNIEKERRLTGNSTSRIRNNKSYELHKDRYKLRQKEYREKTRINKKEYDKIYRVNNKNLKNKQSREYYLKKPYLKAWRTILKSYLRRMNKVKESHTIDLLGYSALELKNHITALFTDGMSWNNYGEWHIDHIKRIREFSPETPSNIVNALSNLRPLWATTREINGVVYEGNLNRG